jgi:Mandelate racemase / muconate lactonizing enzyme, N-terminal domain
MSKKMHTNAANPRRSFLKNLSFGITGGFLASGTITDKLWAKPVTQNDTSLKIVKVEPHLLTGVRGYGPWLFVRVETQEGIVGWGEGTNFPGVQPIAAAVRNLSNVVVGESAWDIERLWNRMYPFLFHVFSRLLLS